MEITARMLEMARIGLGESREEMAQRLGVSVRTIANWENNGVPQHRTALLMSKLGQPLRAAQGALEHTEWLKTPAGERHQEEQYEALVASGEIERPSGSGQAPTNDYAIPVSTLLAPYSTITLLTEVTRRVRQMESNQTPPETTQEDPDYSEVSEADVYDLAAHKGDKHIGHDELPHEP